MIYDKCNALLSPAAPAFSIKKPQEIYNDADCMNVVRFDLIACFVYRDRG